MPVKDGGSLEPQINLTVKQPAGPDMVEADNGAVAKKDMVDLGEPATVDHSDLHTPRSTDMFETPGPVSVVLEGFGVDGESTSPQVKLVKAPAKSRGKGTSGAEGK